MKLKIQEIQAILSSSIYDKSFPTKTSYQIARLAKVLTVEMSTFDTERQKLIEKFNGVLNDEKTQYNFSQEDGTLFTATLNELLSAEIEVSFEPLPLAAFGDVKLTPNDLSLIDPLVAPEV